MLTPTATHRPGPNSIAVVVVTLIAFLLLMLFGAFVYHSQTAKPLAPVAESALADRRPTVDDLKRAFLHTASAMGQMDSMLARRAVQMVEEEDMVQRAGWFVVDEIMSQATHETRSAYRKWRTAYIANHR